jgi:hypothetical protein
MIFTAWKIFERGGDMGWISWVIAIGSLVVMLFKVPERFVIVAAGLVGIIFLS